eukprot:gene18261-24715_t
MAAEENRASDDRKMAGPRPTGPPAEVVEDRHSQVPMTPLGGLDIALDIPQPGVMQRQAVAGTAPIYDMGPLLGGVPNQAVVQDRARHEAHGLYNDGPQRPPTQGPGIGNSGLLLKRAACRSRPDLNNGEGSKSMEAMETFLSKFATNQSSFTGKTQSSLSISGSMKGNSAPASPASHRGSYMAQQAQHYTAAAPTPLRTAASGTPGRPPYVPGSMGGGSFARPPPGSGFSLMGSRRVSWGWETALPCRSDPPS